MSTIPGKRAIWVLAALLGLALWGLLAAQYNLPPRAAASNLLPYRRPAQNCTEEVENGSFESGDFTSWQTSGSPWIANYLAYEGSYSAVVGGYDNADDTFYQTMTLPVTFTSATLNYWWYIDTQEPIGTPMDYFFLEVQDASGNVLLTLQTLDNSSPTGDWFQSIFDLGNYPSLLGQTLRFAFHGVTNATEPTGFFIDEVHLVVCVSSTTPTPTPTETPACLPDNYEPNESQAGAWPVSVPFLESSLRICPADEDWFEFYVDIHYELWIVIGFQHVDGDLDLELYDPDGVRVAYSNSTTDDEEIIYQTTRSGNFAVRVFPFSPPAADSGVSYDISIQQSSAHTPTPTPTWPTSTPTNTPTPTPTHTPTRTPSVLPQLDLQLVDMEVSQGIQNLDHNVDLITGRDTYVRLYVRADRAYYTRGTVGAYLTAESHGFPVLPAQGLCFGTLQNIRPVGTSLAADRANIHNALYCPVPREWMKTPWDQLEIFAHLIVPADVGDPNPNNNERSLLRWPARTHDLNIKIVQLRDGCTDKNCGPSVSDYAGIDRVVRRMLPVGKITLIPDEGIWRKWQGREDTLTELIQLRQQRYNLRNYVLVGVRRSSIWEWYGAAFPGLRVAWVQTHATGDWTLAHELGHAIGGLNHVNACGAPAQPGYENYPYNSEWISAGGDRDHYGLDIGYYSPPRVLEPQKWADIMTYCWGRQWISDHSYNAIERDLRITPKAAESPKPLERQGDTLIVVGSVYTPTGQVSLLPILRRPASELEGDSISPPGPYTVQLRDAGEAVLVEQSFDLFYGEFPAGSAQFFSLLVPYDPAAARLAITDQGSEIYSLAVSPNAPTVAVDPLSGTVADTFTASWTMADLDGDAPTAAVYFSPDGGTTWEPLAGNLEESQAELDTSLWPGTDQGMLRVLVSDGFNVSQDETGPFSVPPKAPLVWILGPTEDSAVQPDWPLSLQATGYDPEDKALADEAYNWTSNLDGALGTGERLVIHNLSPGWHTITVSASDSHGNSANDSVNVYVGYRQYLPAVFR